MATVRPWAALLSIPASSLDEKRRALPGLNQPEASYHGVVYTEAFGPAAYIGRARTVPLRNTGAALSAQSAFQLLQGIETLPLRMERHCENAMAVAKYLQAHDNVEWVSYAGLENHPHHALAQKYMNGTASGIMTFGVKGGFDAGVKFYDALQLFKRLVNIGDANRLHVIQHLPHTASSAKMSKKRWVLPGSHSSVGWH